MFEAIETALEGTVYESLVEDMFFGITYSYIICTECGRQMKVHEKFLDIPLHVEGFKGVKDSLDDFF